jgi:hypothetical protein
MRKPFQFSMARLFIAVAFWCFAARLLVILMDRDAQWMTNGVPWVTVAFFGAASGTGAGILGGRPLFGAVAGALGSVVALTLFFIGALAWFGS